MPFLKPFSVIPGTNNKYSINLDGVVVNNETGRVLKYIEQSGYNFVSLSLNGVSKGKGVHRLLLLTFLPIEGSDKLHCHHHDRNRKNNNLNNLSWVTCSENASIPKVNDLKKGVNHFPHGNKHYRAVLKVKHQIITIGYYHTHDEALQAYIGGYEAYFGIPYTQVSVSSEDLKKRSVTRFKRYRAQLNKKRMKSARSNRQVKAVA